MAGRAAASIEARPGLEIGPGGRPALSAGVVGRVDGQLGFGQRLGVVAGGEADRRVDPQRDPFAQPVVDHGRDQLALAVELRLLLDHRGDRDHVVDGQVLGARVAHVDARDAAFEVLQLQLDEVGDRRAPLQLEGVREEEALVALARLQVVAAQARFAGQLRRLRAAVALGTSA